MLWPVAGICYLCHEYSPSIHSCEQRHPQLSKSSLHPFKSDLVCKLLIEMMSRCSYSTGVQNLPNIHLALCKHNSPSRFAYTGLRISVGEFYYVGATSYGNGVVHTRWVYARAPPLHCCTYCTHWKYYVRGWVWGTRTRRLRCLVHRQSVDLCTCSVRPLLVIRAGLVELPEQLNIASLNCCATPFIAI